MPRQLDLAEQRRNTNEALGRVATAWHRPWEPARKSSRKVSEWLVERGDRTGGTGETGFSAESPRRGGR
jgi:hypothetical protein